MLAADQPGQIAALLVRRAPAADLVDAEIGVGAVGQAHRGRGAGHLLHGHHMLQIAEAKPAPLFLDRNPVQAQLAHLGPQLAGEFIGAVDLRRQGRDLVGGEARGHVADLIRSLAEVEIEGWGVIQGHGADLARAHARRERPGPCLARAKDSCGSN